MMGRLIRQLFATLIATSLIGAPVTATIAMSCDTVVTSAPDDEMSSGQAPAPCKQMMPCCVDMFGCGLSAALPADIIDVVHKLIWTAVAYRAVVDTFRGLSIEPDLGPPITI